MSSDNLDVYNKKHAGLLDSVVLEPNGVAQRSIIWIHGLGADGHDFVPIVPQLNLQDELGIRFVFPHAPSQPVTLNGGYIMPAWFDIYGIDKGIKEDTQGIPKALESINKLIEHEHQKGIAYENIMLVGFSQGGALALYAGLKYPQKLAGIICLSGYLFRFDEQYSTANQDISILMCHGSQDPIVLEQFGLGAKDRLIEKEYNITWRSYPMQHQVCPQEITDIASFIRGVYS